MRREIQIDGHGDSNITPPPKNIFPWNAITCMINGNN